MSQIRRPARGFSAACEMPKRPALSDADILDAIDNYRRQQGALPTVVEARNAIGGPVGNGRICRLLRERKQQMPEKDA